MFIICVRTNVMTKFLGPLDGSTIRRGTPHLGWVKWIQYRMQGGWKFDHPEGADECTVLFHWCSLTCLVEKRHFGIPNGINRPTVDVNVTFSIAERVYI